MADSKKDTAAPAVSGTDWDAVVGADTAPAEPGVRAAPSNLPPFPQGFGYLIGRLPIKGDTGKAVVQLLEPTKGVSCAAVFVNSGVLSDCYRPAKGCGAPTALKGQPRNDREIVVTLDGDSDEVITGPGWVAGSQYPGAPAETRSVDAGVPYVEIMLVVGPDCGCSSENWAPDNEWG